MKMGWLGRIGVGLLIGLEIFAFSSISRAETQDIESLGGAEVVAALRSKDNYVPMRFGNQTTYFTVDPEVKALQVSRRFIAENQLWESYQFKREISSPEARNGLMAGDLVQFYALLVGATAMRNIEAVICDECPEAIGPSLFDFGIKKQEPVFLTEPGPQD